MKLRLRSLETKETTRIELPTPCSIQHLREVVFQRVSSSSSSSSAPPSVHLSLNRKDELLGSSAQDSLQSLGVTSGDLVFFTFNHNAFSSETLIVQSINNNSSNSEVSLVPEPNSHIERTIDQNETLDFESAKAEPVKEETLGSESEIKPGEDQTLGLGTEMEQTPAISGTENMEIDFENDDDGSIPEVGKSFSVPCFLRKVFRKEVGEGGGDDQKLLVIAVHAVLLESGFVGFDSVSGMQVEGFHLSDEWPSVAFTMSLWYTLPEIIDRGPSPALNGVETVVLKIQSLGKYVNVYGSLSRNGSGPYRVCVDEDRVAFFLNLVWANCDEIDEINGKDSGSSNLCPEKEVFEFWKNVKDRLALPLLIDLCEKAGLAPPPCFMRLPTDLKLKILESLPGVDVAKVGCVCSELRYLSSNDDLWKQKFEEQFGNGEGSQLGSHWKEKFAKSWVIRKRRKTVVSERLPRVREPFPLWVPRIIRDPYPLRVPRILGGDHDLGPSVPLGLGWPVRSAPRHNVMPHCNLGGRSF